jgi:hypothetical protein
LDLRWKQESFLHMFHVGNWLYLNYDRMGHGNYRPELDLIKMNYAGRSKILPWFLCCWDHWWPRNVHLINSNLRNILIN